MFRTAVAFFVGVGLFPPEAATQSRFEDVRFVVGTHGPRLLQGEGFDHLAAVLIVDVPARRLRVESRDRSLLDVPFDRLAGFHYEESKYPARMFRRSTPFLTIHHTSADGEAVVDILRLSEDSAPSVLQAIERDTGVRVDRAAATTSFLGLPIHLARSPVVYVTDSKGQRTQGRVTRVTATSIELGPSGRFDSATVSLIQVKDPIWDGVSSGMGYALLPTVIVSMSQCYESCATVWVLTAAGWGIIGAGGVAGALIDRAVMRRAFRRAGAGASAQSDWRPVAGSHGGALRVTFRFDVPSDRVHRSSETEDRP